MQFLIPLAGLLGLEIDDLKQRLRSGAAVYLTVGLFALISLGFALTALNAWLSGLFGPIVGPLIISLGGLLLALGAYGISRLRGNRRLRRHVEHKRSAETTAFLTTAALTALPAILSNPTARKIGLPLGALAAFLLIGSNRDRE